MSSWLVEYEEHRQVGRHYFQSSLWSLDTWWKMFLPWQDLELSWGWTTGHTCEGIFRTLIDMEKPILITGRWLWTKGSGLYALETVSWVLVNMSSLISASWLWIQCDQFLMFLLDIPTMMSVLGLWVKISPSLSWYLSINFTIVTKKELRQTWRQAIIVF